MNNSVQKTKNTWQDGLVMDFSPDNTSATTLTAALNATFITNNGNDMSLQNDMGNGRVETAYLPEGYIPVGTCEFGDIIYIVSYNPLTNKSQIGCFPSPERNISSEELHNSNQSISASDFQEFDKDNNLTGKLKTTSVKKVLIDKKKLNPGDKYIIYTDDKNYLTGNAEVLSNWNQSLNPKYVKLSIVSIEDGGKITYLDSTTKWYDIEDNGKYIINYSQDNKGGKPDIDSYRDMLNSGWSIFSSKVSGKLAILAELETIDTFSCYYIIKDIQDGGVTDNIKYKTYSVQLAYDYQSENGLPPSYLCLTKSQQDYAVTQPTTDGIQLEFPQADLNSGFKCINNEEKILKEFDFFDITIPYSEIIDGKEYRITSPDFVYPFQITPAMDFGRLDHLAVDMTIDFNKIGTGEVDVTKWKYHNSGNTSILQYGLEVYTKPGWKVDDVTIEFYDNQSTPAGIYYVNNKESYTGTFTEYLGLNGENINSKFSKYYSNGDVIGHKGLELSEKPEGLTEPTENNPLVWNESYIGEYLAEDKSIKWYQNDAGTLYSNILYLAKISIKQSKGLDTKSEEDDDTSTDVFYRWFWTNNMYNQYFYSVDDFKNLKFELNLDVQAIFESKSNFEWKQKTIDKLMLGTNLSTTASSNIQYIGQDGVPNINMYTVAGLQDDYGCFTLYAGDKLENLENFNLEIYLGNSTITYDTSELKYEFSQEERSLTQEGAKYLSLTNQEDTTNKSGKIENIDSSNFNPITENNERHPDVFGVTPFTEKNNHITNSSEQIDGNTYKKLSTNLSQCFYISENEDGKKSIELTLSAALFNNAYTEGKVNTKATAPVYVPFINSEQDLKKFGIETIIEDDSVKFVFNTGIVLNMKGANSDGYFSGTKLAYEEKEPGLFKRAIIDDSSYQFELNKELITTYSNDNFINKIWNNINEDLPQFFLVYFGGIDKSNKYGIFYGENVTSYSDITSWRFKRTNEEILKLFGEKPTDSNELNKWQSYLIPGNAFDIESDADLAKINPGNVVAFLGMKYKDGMTIFNQAYFEYVENENSILQQELLNQEVSSKLFANSTESLKSPYPNFAYILYLLLSRMYHKNHQRETGEQIALKNHVKLAPYSTTLTKDIITKLSVKNLNDINQYSSLILMSGIKYNDYLSEIYNKHINTLILDELTNIHTNQTELDIAVIPIFTDVAKNNQLTLNIKSSSLDFPDQEDKGFIEYNGSIKICDNLGENKFYIYNVNDTIPTVNSIPSLYEFNNRSLKIRTSDITANLEYLFPEKTELINSESPLYKSYHRKINKKEYVKSKDFDELNKINDLWDDYSNQTSGGTKLRDVLEEYLQMCFYDETHASDPLENLKNKITNLILNGECEEISYSSEIYEKINTISTTEDNNYNQQLSELYKKITQFNSFNTYLENKIILTDTPTFKKSLENCIKNSFVEDTASIQIIYTSSSDIELTGDSQNEVNVIYLKLAQGISLSNLLYKEIDHPSCELYEIQSPELHFTYDSELKIDEVYNYGMFGVTNKIGNHSEGYTGFLRDIVFDNRYKIVP